MFHFNSQKNNFSKRNNSGGGVLTKGTLWVEYRCFMNKDLPQQLDRESLSQLSKEEGVHIIIEQAIAIKQLQAASKKLQQQIERLRVSRDLDSKTSSKPPSDVSNEKRDVFFDLLKDN